MPDFVLLLPHLITATVIVTASALVTYLLCRWRGRQQDRGNASHFSDSESFETQQQVSRLSSEIAEFQQRDNEAITKIQDLEQEITATDKRQQETVQELARAKRSLANTTATLETAKHERDQLAQEVQRLQEDRENAVKRDESHADSDEKVLELTEALRESEYQVSRLGTEIQLLRTVRTEFEAIRTDNRDLEEDLERLRTDNQAMETHINRLTADANAEREQRLEAERELTESRATITSLQTAATSVPQRQLPPITPAAVKQDGDCLTEIEGIPPGLETKLNGIGITRWAQIAAWTEDDVRNYSDQLGFEDRIQRDEWVEKAQALCGSVKPSQKPPANESVGKDDDDEEDGIEQFSLFASAPIEDPPTPEPSGPEASTGSSNDEDLILNDPTLGKVYRRPPSIIDDLTRIKGIARVIEGRLHEIGIFRYQQIAEWSASNVEAFSKRLTFKDRIQRDQWISQCQELHQEKYGDS